MPLVNDYKTRPNFGRSSGRSIGLMRCPAYARSRLEAYAKVADSGCSEE